MVLDVSKLRGRIIEKYGTIDAFAEKAHCSRGFISKYLNHRTYLNQQTIILWAGLLEIGDDELYPYFFATEVIKSEQTEALDYE